MGAGPQDVLMVGAGCRGHEPPWVVVGVVCRLPQPTAAGGGNPARGSGSHGRGCAIRVSGPFLRELEAQSCSEAVSVRRPRGPLLSLCLAQALPTGRPFHVPKGSSSSGDSVSS